MANSKHAHLRYNILDYCFREKAFDFEQLLEYTNEKIAVDYPGEGISIRTLREDIKLLEILMGLMHHFLIWQEFTGTQI